MSKSLGPHSRGRKTHVSFLVSKAARKEGAKERGHSYFTTIPKSLLAL